MIQRLNYLSRLIQLRDQHLIKVITGIRRCGKSTLMNDFCQYLRQHAVPDEYIKAINFEEREHSQYASWQEVYDCIMNNAVRGHQRYVFLDEVQLLPHFEQLVDALYVHPDVDIYMTGSNAFLLSSELSTLLSGRYITINVHTFSFAEYVDSFPTEHNTDRLFRQYMNASSFPEAVNLSKTSPNMVNVYLKSLYDTVVIKDIVQRQHLRKFDTMQNLISFIYDSIGSVVSPNNIAQSLKQSGIKNLSHNTILKYLRYFTESYLIYPVRLYNIKGKKLLESNYKYYVTDLGLRNIFETNLPTQDLGHKLENVVYFELLRRGGNVYAGRTDHQEVDFVVQKYDGSREYYQVAYTVNDEKTLNREISSLMNIRDAYPKYLLTMDFDSSNINGIQKINIIDWLLPSPSKL